MEELTPEEAEALELKTRPPSSRRNQYGFYWDEIIKDGNAIRFSPHEVANFSPRKMRTNCNTQARHRGLRARVSQLEDGGLLVRFYRG
jgi:hypothetical protein